MLKSSLIERIEAYAAAAGTTPSAITKRAVDNHRLYATLVAGGSCTLDVAERLVVFMDQHPLTPSSDPSLTEVGQ